MFDTLPAPGFLGVEDLISEDCYCLSTEEVLEKVLDELLSAAGRGSNWRQFCAQKISIFSRKGSSSVGDMQETLEQRPPIVSLLWLCSTLRGQNQVKALSLMAIALEDDNNVENLQGEDRDAAHFDDVLFGVKDPSSNSDPSRCLHLGVSDLVAFIKQFVLQGRSKALRAISSNVAKKLTSRFSSSERNSLLSCLVNGTFQQVGSFGNASHIFCDLVKVSIRPLVREGLFRDFIMRMRLLESRPSFLLQNLIECCSELDLSRVSEVIASSFMNQMTTLNHQRGLCRRESTALSSQEGCDLSNCLHCINKKALKASNKKADASSQSTSKDACHLPEQVRSYERGPLETLSAASTSSEFSSYNQLKFRVALSEVYVSVSDPRGRLVKTIGVYFTPRQVSDANVLKSDKYLHLWQKCGKLYDVFAPKFRQRLD